MTSDAQHELGNASLLLDAAISLLRDRHPGEDEDLLLLMIEVKRRVDAVAARSPDRLGIVESPSRGVGTGDEPGADPDGDGGEL